MPGPPVPFPVPEGPPPQAANAPPPTPTRVSSAPVLITDRRLRDWKVGFRERLGASCAHADAQRYAQVIADRPVGTRAGSGADCGGTRAPGFGERLALTSSDRSKY
ncbi:hypothetical protein GCM10023321_01200 [Pseudonocardia eucalypti]|uniref:Uncharacterized protein n=1 Tax=Pseudonocardia eucalypti TaxID=648755 RepID=A0ABP9PCY7_9PSEU